MVVSFIDWLQFYCCVENPLVASNYTPKIPTQIERIGFTLKERGKVESWYGGENWVEKPPLEFN
jgi:hypothetical protein